MSRRETSDRVSLLLAVALALACAEPPSPPPPPPVPDPGLLPLAQVEQPTMGPHLAEIVGYGEHLYVANSNDGFAVYRRGDVEAAEPGLVVELARVEDVGDPRCTTLAIHEPSASLYCGNDDSRGINRYDLSDPAAPAYAGYWGPLDDVEPRGMPVHDLEVIGDRLWLSRYDAGLSSTSIASDGVLGELIEHPQDPERASNLRVLDSGQLDGVDVLWTLGVDLLDDERVATRLSVHTLGAGDEPAVLASITLDGPPLGLGVDGARVIVALGSGGAEIVRWSGATEVSGAFAREQRLTAGGVVTAVDLQGDVAVATTMTGAHLFDLRGEQPRLAGWHRGGRRTQGEHTGSMLYAKLIGGELLVSDWNFVHRFALDLDGEPYGVDVARGVFAGYDQPVLVPLRSVAAVRQRVEMTFAREVVASTWIEPGAIEIVELPAEVFPVGTPAVVPMRVLAGPGDELVARTGVVVLRREPIEDRPLGAAGKPPPGSPMPEIVVASGPPNAAMPLSLPSDNQGRAFRLVFYGADCVAMWPELDDLLWRARNGALDDDNGPKKVVLISHHDIDTTGYAERMLIETLDNLDYGYFGTELPPEIAALAPDQWSEIYDDAFALHLLPSAAYHPTDYEIDAEGVVLTVEREYRGSASWPGW